RALRPPERLHDVAARLHARRARDREALHAQPRLEGHRPRVLPDAGRDAKARARPAPCAARARGRRQAAASVRGERDPEDGQAARRGTGASLRACACAGRSRSQVPGGRRSAALRARPAAGPAAPALARVRGERRLRGPPACRGASRGTPCRRALNELGPLLARIRLAVFDFDGVFTDNHVWVNERGEESVCCCRADGFGLARLREVGVEAVILSTERVQIVTARAGKLERPGRHGRGEKLAGLREEADARGVSLADTAYVGNDINDAACLEAVGLPVVPADAWPEVAGLARWTLERRGGEGCVREFCDAVWTARR